ncbi:MAG: hypothetical protein JXB05_04075 [Myxococcaceae bacterium]|nr:hypothetical protein [Myxococcaceae bacterium]
MTSSTALAMQDYLPPPGPMLHAVTKKKRDLEDRYLLAPFSRRRPSIMGQPEHIERVIARARRQELSSSANFLELCLISAGLTEATRHIGTSTLSEYKMQGHRLLDECARITGLDPRPVLLRNHRMLQGELRGRGVEALPPAEDVLSRMVQVARSVVAACPIRILERWGHELDAAVLSHRCRKAYDGLVAFARRYVPELNDQIQTVGRAYSEGRLSLDDVSRILQMSPHEAVALLEQCSFCRSFDAISIDPSRRKDRLRAIAAELQTSSKDWNPPSEDLLNRDVIASQRIEGVDAHPWLAQSGG